MKKAISYIMVSQFLQLFTGNSISAQDIDKQPNIVLIITDQWRKQAIGFAGEDQVITPRLDELAAESVYFRNSYCARPICGPDRACILTGQYPVNNGVYGNSVRMSTASETLGTVASANGYKTAYIGKWHLDGPDENFVPPERRSGFDYWIMSKGHQPFNQEYYIQERVNGTRMPGTWEPEWITDKAIEYIGDQKADPFLMVVSYGPPHTGGGIGFEDRWQPGKRNADGEIHYGYGYAAPAEYEALYPDPENYPRRPNVEPVSPYGDPSWQTIPGYFGAVSSIDYQVGRLIDSLKLHGLFDNTIVFFTSDHGEMLGSQGRMTKGIWYEESVGIPAIMSYPGKNIKGEVSAMFSSIDIFPTLCGLAGLPVPEAVDGKDFSPFLTGKDQELSPYLFTCFDHGSPATGDRSWRAVNTEQYVFVLAKTSRYGAEDDIREDGMVLYDKLADPYQMSPVYRGMGYDAVIDSLYHILEDHLKQNGDRFIEEQWKTDNGPYYFYNDALTRDMIPEQRGLIFGVAPEPSDHLFAAADYAPFPVVEDIAVEKEPYEGRIMLQIDAALENDPGRQLYVSRFQERICIARDIDAEIGDYRHIDAGEVLKIIFKMISIRNTDTGEKRMIELSGISFRQMKDDEVAVFINGTEVEMIRAGTDEDYLYLFTDPVDVVQGDTLMINTLSGSWRMNGLSFNVKGSSSFPAGMQYNISARSGGLIIYPNPSGQSIKISGARPRDTIIIADLKGKVLIETQEDVMDVSKLLAGVYFVVAGTASGSFIKY
jgi:arylsulfatase A-like enzyme